MAKLILTITAITMGLLLGAGATLLVLQGNNVFVTQDSYTTKKGFLTPIPTLEAFIVEGDNEPNGIRIHVVNASRDENLEFEFEMDLTDAGYSVVDPTREDPIEETTLHYKPSNLNDAEELAKWLEPRYYPELVEDIDKSRKYDLKLVIGTIREDDE